MKVEFIKDLFRIMGFELSMLLIIIIIGICTNPKQTPPPPPETIVEKTWEYTAEFSAYSLSEAETDGDPCIGSRSLNLCKLKPILEERGLKICASRDLPLDTMIYIEGVGECIILDRMNLRYLGTGNIDILMDSKEVANDFGRKEVRYNKF